MSKTPLWLDEPALQHLFAATRAAGGEARAVGGAVRDFLMEREGGDVDIASSLPPETTMAIAEQAGWKAVPTGLAYGTVTLVLPSRVVEVTTLRRDMETDGRHAVVAYTDSFAEDAARRDFTINALYMDAEGIITDPVGGQEDIATRHIRFIGDAGQRIREDGLRMLRFFRFLATHGQPPVDEKAVAAIGSLKYMLDQLSGERIQQEMKKLLAAADPSYALARMSMLAMGEPLCGQAWQLGLLQPLLQIEAQHKLLPNRWMRLLAMIAPECRIEAAQQISQRWKLSRADMQWLEFLTAPHAMVETSDVREALRHYKREWVIASLLLQALDRGADVALLIPVARSFDPPVFPVTARDLLAKGMSEGKELGDALRALEQRWVTSGYRLGKESLLGEVD